MFIFLSVDYSEGVGLLERVFNPRYPEAEVDFFEFETSLLLYLQVPCKP